MRAYWVFVRLPLGEWMEFCTFADDPAHATRLANQIVPDAKSADALFIASMPAYLDGVFNHVTA